MKNIFQKLKDERQKREEQTQQLEQDKLKQQQGQFEQQRQDLEEQHKSDQENDNYQKELDRISKKEIAIISSIGYGKVTSEDSNDNGIQDVLELSSLDLESKKALSDHTTKMLELQRKAKEGEDKKDIELQKLQLEKDKLKADKEKTKIEASLEKKNMANDLAISKQNAKGRNKTPKKK